MIECQIVIGSAHIQIIDGKIMSGPDAGKDNVIGGAYGINDQQAFDRLKRLINHRLKETAPTPNEAAR